ncbi:Hypothetical predicted protein [Pelobates cultripes]|uniref:Uncharacterized protein n=1 Tax=Pelobates cultripes TaxID=61616 RepID=A0AAD1VPY5_PELCU|nr:Hypothetical predicted protein [Pelobates cultripes]
MQTPNEYSAPGPSYNGDAKAHHRPTVSEPLALQGDVATPLEHLDSEEFHSLLDATMSKSVTQAIYTAMGVMSDNISQSISNAIKGSNPNITHARASEEGPLCREGRKAISKTHNVGKHASKNELTDRVRPVTPEVVGPP